MREINCVTNQTQGVGGGNDFFSLIASAVQLFWLMLSFPALVALSSVILLRLASVSTLPCSLDGDVVGFWQVRIFYLEDLHFAPCQPDFSAGPLYQFALETSAIEAALAESVHVLSSLWRQVTQSIAASTDIAAAQYVLMARLLRHAHG